MNRFRVMLAKQLFKGIPFDDITDAVTIKKSGGASGRELASTVIKQIIYKSGNSSGDFEDPDYSFNDIANGYNTDSYIRQGVDKYVDQIFKEGYSFYGNDANVVDYLKLRLAYIAEATSTPTNQFLIEIAEDLVKYGNAMIVKVRSNDPTTLPPGVTATGLNGKDAVVGYFLANPTTMKCKRDDYGTIQSWQQESDSGNTQEFTPEDVIHFYYKRERGNAYGTSFLIPVLDDVRALRQAEENVLKMMYRNIYPFHHVAVGTEDTPGNDAEVTQIENVMNDMDIDGSLVTTERVKITPIASDKVIDGEPYLRYMEERVFSGMGIPGILFGRGGTSNRSTGDNMTSEMADRIRALCKILEMFFNAFVVKEILMEGGYDPVLNPDQNCEFKFNDNDVDVKIKKETHAIYKYEHNSISENEMREEMGLDPITDEERKAMHLALVTFETTKNNAALAVQKDAAAGKTGTPETNNKEKNSGGRVAKKKSEPKDYKLSYDQSVIVGFLKDRMEDTLDDIVSEINVTVSDTESILNRIVYDIAICNRNVLYSIKDKASESENVINVLSDRVCDTLRAEIIRSPDNLADTASIIFGVYIDSVINTVTDEFYRKGEKDVIC